MLFHKPLVSFVAAIALASSVTASATPVRRNGPPAGQSCSTGSLTCCDSTSPFSSLSGLIKGLLDILVPDLNVNADVGLNCLLAGTLGWYCNPSTFVFDQIANAPQQQSGILLLWHPEPGSVSFFFSTAIGTC